MLQLGASSLVIDGVTVFRDHADPSLFWYLPAPVRLSERPGDDEPAFTLVVYKPAAVAGGAKGGGFLMFEVDLRLDEDVRRRILGELRRFAPEPVLSPVPFDDGEVQCVALNVQGPAGTRDTGAFAAVEEILGAAVPSLFGDNKAIFSLTLSTAGATVMRQVFDQGGAPVGVIYKLRFTALRPALHVRISAELSRVYQELSLGLNVQVYWVRAGIEAAFQKLVQDGVITIEVADFVPGGERAQQEQWALDFFRDKLLAEWFEPSLSPSGQPVSTTGTAPSSSSGTPAATHPMSGTAGVPGSPAGTGTSGGVPPGAAAAPAGGVPGAGPAGMGAAPAGAAGAPPAGSSPTASGGPPPPPPPVGAPPTGGPGAVQPPPPPPPPPPGTGATASVPGRAPAVAPLAGTSPAGAQAAAGGADPALVSCKLRYVRQEELKRVTLTLDRAEAVQRIHAPQGFFGLLAGTLAGPGHFVEVDLDDPFFREFTVTMQCGVDFTALGLRSISVALEYGRPTDPGGPKRATFVFDANDSADRGFGVYVNPALDTAYRYVIEYNFRGEAGWAARETAYRFAGETEDRTLDLDPSLRLGFLDVTVEPADLDPGAIAFTDVHLAYRDPNGWTQEKTLVVRPDGATQHWRVRSDTRLAGAYTYSFTHTLVDGSVIAVEPRTATETRVAVVDPFPGRLDLLLVPSWDGGAGVRTVFVELTYDDAASGYHRELRVELPGSHTTTTQAHIALRDPKVRDFCHRFTFVAPDGQVRRTPFVSTTDTLVLISPP
ncbi:hypothetical protein ABZT47_34665 [Sphaerisporangium sp. NPDC005289]|uniref:hypothetical protein n=1 Tax=Sphaerisporangium sp. NPDC005289 TaxID=3155247 RepID=UPI00339E4065